MKTKKFTLLVVSLVLLSCGKETNKTQQEKLTLDSFTDLPEDIDGCSCIFAEDSVAYNNNKYLYANDFAKTSFVKINGKLIKLTETEYTKSDSLTTISKSKGGGYKVEIKATIFKTTDLESNEMKGTITITPPKGKTIVKTVYGVCGC